MHITEAKNTAMRLFLGQEVVGVGILNAASKELIFLLHHESATTERLIRAWALEQDVVARFKVTGRIRT